MHNLVAANYIGFYYQLPKKLPFRAIYFNYKLENFCIKIIIKPIISGNTTVTVEDEKTEYAEIKPSNL